METSFYYYLKQSGLSEPTIKCHLQDLARFTTWAKETNRKDIEHITYTELLQYVQHEKSKQLATATINIRLNSIRKYYDHLKQENIIETNPARRLHIKGELKKITINPLTYMELEALYHEYAKPKEHYREKKNKQTHKRNTIILGLMIWQALHSGELGRLETNHINLDEGKIYIPSTGRSNNRELKIESKQIIRIHEYLNETEFKNEKLFPVNMHNTVQYITEEIKGINPVLQNAQHIRASVILHWLRMYGKRQVQYMIGHRYIGSTEKYETEELESLTSELMKHHPFG